MKGLVTIAETAGGGNRRLRRKCLKWKCAVCCKFSFPLSYFSLPSSVCSNFSVIHWWNWLGLWQKLGCNLMVGSWAKAAQGRWDVSVYSRKSVILIPWRISEIRRKPTLIYSQLLLDSSMHPLVEQFNVVLIYLYFCRDMVSWIMIPQKYQVMPGIYKCYLIWKPCPYRCD